MDDQNREFDRAAAGPSLGWLSAVMVVIAAVTLIGFRLHAFNLPLETDECNYAYVAARLMDGDRLYVDVWDHQPPGVFMLFAGMIALFGDAPIVFRLLACAFSIASMLLIYGLVRRLAGSWPAIAAAFLFAIVSSDPGTAGEGCQREIYMNALILAAWYLAVGRDEGTKRRRHEATEARRNEECESPRHQDTKDGRRNNSSEGIASESPSSESEVGRASCAPDVGQVLAPVETIIPSSTAALVASGLCLGVASLIKTVVAVHWLALVAWVFVTRNGTAQVVVNDVRRSRLKRVIALVIGPSIVWGATFAYFAATDRWAAFVDAVFTFNLGYSGDKTLLARLFGFFTPDRHPFIFDSAVPLWIAGAIATLILIVRFSFRKDNGALNIALLAIASFIAVCLPGRSWPHYYYLMIPPLVIITVYVIALLTPYVSAPTSGRSHGSASKKWNPLSPPLVRGEALMRQSVCALAITVFACVLFCTLYTQYRDYLSQPPFGITVKRYNSRDFWGRAQGENVKRVTDPNDAIFVFGNDASIYYYAERRCASRYTMITGLADGMPGAERRRETLLEELRANPPRLILAVEPPFHGFPEFLNENYTEVGVDLHDRTRLRIMWVFARHDALIEPIDWDWDRSSVGGWQLGAKGH